MKKLEIDDFPSGQTTPNSSIHLKKNEQVLVRNQNDQQQCTVHNEINENLFCVTCESCDLCVKCLTQGQHHNHNVVSMKQASQFAKDKLQDLEQDIIEKIRKLNDRFKQMENIQNEIQSSYVVQKENVSQSFEILKEIIQQQEQETLKQLQDDLSYKIRLFDPLMDQIKKEAINLKNTVQKVNEQYKNQNNPSQIIQFYCKNFQDLSNDQDYNSLQIIQEVDVLVRNEELRQQFFLDLNLEKVREALLLVNKKQKSRQFDKSSSMIEVNQGLVHNNSAKSLQNLLNAKQLNESQDSQLNQNQFQEYIQSSNVIKTLYQYQTQFQSNKKGIKIYQSDRKFTPL